MTVRARIIDSEALTAVSPVALRAYAVAEGWRRVESFGEHSDVYLHSSGGPEVIVPGTVALGDYPNVVAAIVSLFAKTEGRDELQVFRDLAVADRDVVRVRAPHADDDGSIAIEAGVELVVHARDLLLSAACSAWQPRPAYRAGKVKKAEDYMERVRLGQTEQGSFVVTLLSPVPPALEAPLQPSLWPLEDDEPYERLVTRRFVDGLSAARSAVESSNRGASFEVFEEAVMRGVSANLCEAAAQLIESGDGLDVSVTWARTRATPVPRRGVTFARSDGEVLREAARLFHERQPRPDERLEGYIIKLGREETAFDGRVTFRAFVEGRITSIQVDFPQQLYEQALEAHRNKRIITVTGNLERQGKRWRLKEPRDLQVGVDEDSSDDGVPG